MTDAARCQDRALARVGWPSGETPFAVRYRIACDAGWHARSVMVDMIGDGRTLVLASDGDGRWTRNGLPMPELAGVLDPDLTVTPFTNTLPIRRLALSTGQSAEITTGFIDFPALSVVPNPQRYTCLEEGRRYLYESRASDFRRELEIDRDGLVVDYPDFWRRG
ncbi:MULTISPECIES: putative glycolipid-binding domain-containing protein [unclassified Mesorhizobium]|uniref:putative glycolipid-binding domain-containing protein n=1 Tax=unclassified Mesorhizobium TaxID=325217 RepID=UPI001CC9F089|nr:MULTISPECIES: putative glycolipid-binding domain-containing protein [unclassified Mesorhizobium]MBZ9740423.1 putative glycolipid-binding domain-containing protein [Mesorhizobium sp. CO1-1-4]MBZ9800416.1 putative glycolipid-binding domain-containing protein [Mesorhizobium sp. ES1-6]